MFLDPRKPPTFLQPDPILKTSKPNNNIFNHPATPVLRTRKVKSDSPQGIEGLHFAFSQATSVADSNE
jgi:hypothetical protein